MAAQCRIRKIFLSVLCVCVCVCVCVRSLFPVCLTAITFTFYENEALLGGKKLKYC